MQQLEHRQPRSLDQRLANGVVPPAERGDSTYVVPQNVINDLFAESREWRAEVKECRMEVGRVREAANAGTFFSGGGLGLLIGILACVFLYVALKR